MASQSFRKLICHTLGTNFRQCTKIVTAQLPAPAAGTVIVRNQICGVNASDVNYTNGVYAPGVQPPFDTGFEAVGRVERCGEGVTKVKEGDYVVFSAFGAFSERMVLDARAAVPIPKPAPEALSVIVSGLTASIALQHIGKMQPGQKVVVTAAAGATGSYAVQLARLAGCEVIGTCSSDEKAEALRKLGCHRPINYKKENLFETLRKEYPKGVDLVYESVGGQVFDACINNLATHGFFLNHFAHEWRPHMKLLLQHMGEGKVTALIDPTKFQGLEQVPDAIEHMYAGKNTGKVTVTLPE